MTTPREHSESSVEATRIGGRTHDVQRVDQRWASTLHDYQPPPTTPRVVVQQVATGGLVDFPSVPPWVRHVASDIGRTAGSAVLVLELGDARFETEVLLDMLTPLAQEIRAGRFGDVVLVVATRQQSVARIVEMVALTEDLPMYLTPDASKLSQAQPAGRLTETERESLAALSRLGGRVTASQFASAAALEITAAGNRLSNLARRGYVFRIPRSRREGDEYLSLAWLTGGTRDWSRPDEHVAPWAHPADENASTR